MGENVACKHTNELWLTLNSYLEPPPALSEILYSYAAVHYNARQWNMAYAFVPVGWPAPKVFLVEYGLSGYHK